MNIYCALGYSPSTVTTISRSRGITSHSRRKICYQMAGSYRLNSRMTTFNTIVNTILTTKSTRDASYKRPRAEGGDQASCETVRLSDVQS